MSATHGLARSSHVELHLSKPGVDDEGLLVRASQEEARRARAGD